MEKLSGKKVFYFGKSVDTSLLCALCVSLVRQEHEHAYEHSRRSSGGANFFRPFRTFASAWSADTQIIRGHWDVLHYGDVVVWSCRCGRSQPITISARDSSNVLLPFDGIHACEICRSELQRASCKSEGVSLRGSTCTAQPSIPRLAWSFPRTAVCTKGPMTTDTNAPGGLSTRNSGEKRLKQSTVCALSAVIQSVSTHTTYA